MIHARHLRKTYWDLRRSEVVALNSVSFDAREGEIFGILGPNGAGKTTLLRILATVLKPTRGSATVNGYDVTTSPSEVRRQIGFVSNNTAIYDRMTPVETVEYFGRLHGLTEDLLQERTERILRQLQMEDIRDRLGSKLSTGMRQKVSIARALVHDPAVLVFDEATAGLDVVVGRSLLRLISQLRDEGKCILFSTHIMHEAERLCDRIAIIHRGRFLTTGSPQQLLADHAETDLEELFFQLISREQQDGEILLSEGATPSGTC